MVAGPDGDTLIGGPGNDYMVAGAGHGDFVLSPGDGNDWIDGFTPGSDHISFTVGITAADIRTQALTIAGVDGLGVYYGSGDDSVFLANVAALLPGDLVFAQPPVPPGALDLGTTGDDAFGAGGGGDTLIGGPGNDYMVGGAGAESSASSRATATTGSTTSPPAPTGWSSPAASRRRRRHLGRQLPRRLRPLRALWRRGSGVPGQCRRAADGRPQLRPAARGAGLPGLGQAAGGAQLEYAATIRPDRRPALSTRRQRGARSGAGAPRAMTSTSPHGLPTPRPPSPPPQPRAAPTSRCSGASATTRCRVAPGAMSRRSAAPARETTLVRTPMAAGPRPGRTAPTGWRTQGRALRRWRPVNAGRAARLRRHRYHRHPVPRRGMRSRLADGRLD